MLLGDISMAVLAVVLILLSIIRAMYTPMVSASIPLLVKAIKIESANGIVTAMQPLGVL